MEWQKSESGASKMVNFSANAGQQPAALALQAMWRLIAEEVVPRNTDVQWDHVRAEIWADTGRIIAFPATADGRPRKESSRCQLIIPEWLAAYERWDHADTGDEAGLTNLENTWAAQVVAAAETALGGKTAWHLAVFSADDESPLVEVSLPQETRAKGNQQLRLT